MPSPSCPADIRNDQKGDDMASLKDRVIQAVAKILSTISMPMTAGRPAFQRLPVTRVQHPLLRRRK